MSEPGFIGLKDYRDFNCDGALRANKRLRREASLKSWFRHFFHLKQMLGIDQLDTTTAKRLFKSLCEILPEVVSQKHVEELSGKDRIFKNVLEKVSD